MIIDIRDFSSYQKGHLNGAISIPFNKLLLYPEKYLRKDVEYRLYCNSGSQSKMLTSYLNRLGYHCVNIEGGYLKNLFK